MGDSFVGARSEFGFAHSNGGLPAISVVVPCFNEQDGLDELLRRVRLSVQACFAHDYELVLVDDGSRDGTWARMQAAASADPHLRLIRLSRNHGHQLALTAGLAAAQGALVFVIDADLQDPPELLGPMAETLRAQGADVVYGLRRQRKGETLFKKLSAAAFYRLLSRSADIDLPLDAGDFRLMMARIAKALVAMPETDRFIRGMVAWIGFKQVPFEYDRDARFAGETKYPLREMLRLASHAFMGFSMLPLRFAAQISALLFAIMLIVIVYALVSWLFFDVISGWTSLMILISFSSAMQFAVLAVIGEYVGRIYLTQKARPLYIVDQVIGLAPAALADLGRGQRSPLNAGIWPGPSEQAR